jgi:hypothetical protein
MLRLVLLEKAGPGVRPFVIYPVCRSHPPFTIRATARRVLVPAGKQRFRRPVNSETKAKHMGDKSPKANQKMSSQKQSKANSADQKKKQAVAAKKK